VQSNDCTMRTFDSFVGTNVSTKQTFIRIVGSNDRTMQTFDSFVGSNDCTMQTFIRFKLSFYAIKIFRKMKEVSFVPPCRLSDLCSLRIWSLSMSKCRSAIRHVYNTRICNPTNKGCLFLIANKSSKWLP